MCGIIGYVGFKQVMPILLNGLRSQEYRGYDSAGIVLLEDNQLRLIRSKGKIKTLEEKIGDNYGEATFGIGHTRWATHGEPSEANAHPHLDCKKQLAMIHNGIIENYLELRQDLLAKGHKFCSETDTEVLPHLLENYYQGDLKSAFMRMVKDLRGAYAMVAMSKLEPRKLMVARKESPLVIGIGDGEYFVASDMAALIEYTRDIIVLQNGDIAEITEQGVVVYHDDQPVERQILHIDWDKQAAQKGGYPHFMLKEIMEQPQALRQAMNGRITLDRNDITLDGLDLPADYWHSINKITLVACGTAYHAGMIGKSIMEKLLRQPVEVDVASEFRYRDPLIDDKTLVIVISQSGETADTLQALRNSKQQGAKTIAICNVVASSITNEADHVLYTYAGPEIAVASTKAYITQLMVLYLLTLFIAKKQDKIADNLYLEYIRALAELPDGVQTILDTKSEQIKGMADTFCTLNDQCSSLLRESYAYMLKKTKPQAIRRPDIAKLAEKPYDHTANVFNYIERLTEEICAHKPAFFIGRGLDYGVALEGALKLKEISYIHAEAYAAGELKHGTIALIVPQLPIVALCTQSHVIEKMISNIAELNARKAHVLGIAFEGLAHIEEVCAEVLYLPKTLDDLAPILAVIPLQLLAYYASVARNCDVDQPRNLAKSVTVE